MTLLLRLALGLLVLAAAATPHAQSLRWVPVTESLARPDSTPVPRVLERTPTGALIAGARTGLYRRAADGPWVRTTADTLRDVQATALAVRGSELFVGTYGFGVLRSADDGRSWQADGFSGESLLGIVVLPDGALVAVDGTGQAYRREAGATAWRAAGRPDASVYTSAGALAVLADGTLLLRASVRLYRSTDRGGTWADTGLEHVRGNVDQAMDGAVYTVALGRTNRSTDSGVTWQAMGRAPLSNDYLLDAGSDGFLYLGVGVDGESGVQRSADGASWTWVYRAPGYGGVSAVVAPSVASPRLYVSDGYHGLVQLDPPYDTWQAVNDGFVREPSAYVMAAIGSRLLFTDLRFYATDDRGQTWASSPLDEYSNYQMVGLQDGTLLRDVSSGVARSTDLGATWQTVPLPPVGTRTRSAHSFLQTSTGAVLVGAAVSTGFGANGDVLRSDDGGLTWTPTQHPPGRSLGPVRSIVQTDTGTLFAGHRSGGWEGGGAPGLARSDDDGRTWVVARVGSVWSLVPLPGGRLLVVTEDSLFHASPTGEVWEPLGRARGGSTIVRTADGAVYSTGSGTGIDRSLDEGATWEPFNDGLANRFVLSLAASPDGSLYAGTTNGVFRATAVVAGEALPDAEAAGLAPPRPNPTTGATAFTFTLPDPSDVHLAVFDALGRRVAVLAEGTHEAGAHAVAWDAAGLAPGVYLVVLRAGGATATRRVSVVR